MSSITGGSDEESRHNCSDVNSNSDTNNDDDNSESSVDSEDLYGGEPYEFDEEAFDLLKRNHKYAGWVQFSGWSQEQVDFLCSISWRKDGNVISSTTKLKNLNIEGCEDILENMDEKKRKQFALSAKCFYRSIAENRSIKILGIDRSLLDSVDTFSILSPFIEQNQNLDFLSLGRLVLDSKSVTLLTSALTKCNLRSISLERCDNMTAEFMTQIVNAVGVCGIQNLYLDKYDMDDDVGIALGKSLYKHNTLKTLSLTGEIDHHSQIFIGSITPVGMDAIAVSLASGSLEKLYLGNTYIGREGAAALARGLADNSTLKTLVLHDSNVELEGGISLAAALEGNATLEELDLSNAMFRVQGDTILSADGWIYFFDSLRNCALRHLDLRGSPIGDENIQTMVDSLNTRCPLQS